MLKMKIRLQTQVTPAGLFPLQTCRLFIAILGCAASFAPLAKAQDHAGQSVVEQDQVAQDDVAQENVTQGVDGSVRLIVRTSDSRMPESRPAYFAERSDVEELELAFTHAEAGLPLLPQQPVPSQQPASAQSQPHLPDAPNPSDTSPAAQQQRARQIKRYCRFKPCPEPFIDWYMRFENGPGVKKMTPMQKGWLAARNVIDPFNIITILGISAISVAADSHSAYGPGFPGWGRYVGVSFTENITGEFFGTFLICSIAHQDPHYHRLPDASYKKRIFHALYQVAWTQGDDGKGMLNYSDLLGAGIDDEIANLYVPGRSTRASATVQRYGIALATAPIDNFITEFLPDVARRIHIQVVVVQRIIDTVANDRATNGGS